MSLQFLHTLIRVGIPDAQRAFTIGGSQLPAIGAPRHRFHLSRIAVPGRLPSDAR